MKALVFETMYYFFVCLEMQLFFRKVLKGRRCFEEEGVVLPISRQLAFFVINLQIFVTHEFS